MVGHLCIGDRWRIVSLHFDQNILPIQIASIILCSIQTVCNILQLYQESNNVIERQGRGRSSLNNNIQLQDSMKLCKILQNLTHYEIISFATRKTFNLKKSRFV